MDKFQIIPHLLALGVAYALALPIGWDREKEARSAGLRTFPLVALASCGFVQATETFLTNSPEGTARIVEGLITGMGFIGGGAILEQGNSVHGTATAASLWATGAIGTAVGLGSFEVAVTIAAFTFLTLKLLPLVKNEHNLNATGRTTSEFQKSTHEKCCRSLAGSHRRLRKNDGNLGPLVGNYSAGLR